MGNEVRVGPWGGEDGKDWESAANGGRVTTINLRTGAIVYSLGFIYTDKNGKQQLSEPQPSPVTTNSLQQPSPTTPASYPPMTTIVFADDEDLTAVSGTFGPYLSKTVVTSLSFKTNKEVYGPFGGETGNSTFSLPLEKGKFEGFFGKRSVDVIDALGAILVP